MASFFRDMVVTRSTSTTTTNGSSHHLREMKDSAGGVGSSSKRHRASSMAAALGLAVGGGEEGGREAGGDHGMRTSQQAHGAAAAAAGNGASGSGGSGASSRIDHDGGEAMSVHEWDAPQQELVVVAVCKNEASCKGALQWAERKCLEMEDSVLCLLHVVDNIYLPALGMDQRQSQMSPQMRKLHAETVVNPMLNKLKEMVKPQVKVRFKVAFHDSVEKGLVVETIGLNASMLVMGSSWKRKRPRLFAACKKDLADLTSIHCVLRDGSVASHEATSSATLPSPSGSSSSKRALSAGGAFSRNNSFSSSAQTSLPKLLTASTISERSSNSGTDEPDDDAHSSHSRGSSREFASQLSLPSPARFAAASAAAASGTSFDNSSRPRGDGLRAAAAVAPFTDAAANAPMFLPPFPNLVASAAHPVYPPPPQEAAQSNSAAPLAPPAVLYRSITLSEAATAGAFQRTASSVSEATARMAFGQEDGERAFPNGVPPPWLVTEGGGRVQGGQELGHVIGDGFVGHPAKPRTPQMRGVAEDHPWDVSSMQSSLTSVQVALAKAAEEKAMALRQAEQALQLAEVLQAAVAVERGKAEAARRQAAEANAALQGTRRGAAAQLEGGGSEMAGGERGEGSFSGSGRGSSGVGGGVRSSSGNKAGERAGVLPGGTLEERLTASIRSSSGGGGGGGGGGGDRGAERPSGGRRSPSLSVSPSVANGSSDALPWFARVRILAEVASALLALHSRPVPILHRDVKPSNVQLDGNLKAKLCPGVDGVSLRKYGADSGRVHSDRQGRGRIEGGQSESSNGPVVGEQDVGYLDPESQRKGDFTPASDVYSLGMMILDVMSGKRRDLLDDMEEAVEDGDGKKLVKLLDQSAGELPEEIALQVIGIAVKCADFKRRKRPSLEEVMVFLRRATEQAMLEEDKDKRKTQMKNDVEEAPKSFFCPITQEIMTTPVVASDGYTYEEDAIRMWLRSHDVSPLTNTPLASKNLMKNHALSKVIEDWRGKSRALRLEGFVP